MAPEHTGTQMLRCYQFVAALLAGRQLDRRTIAALLGVREAAADAHLKALVAAKLPGVRVDRHRNRRIVSWRAGEQATPASIQLAVAACFGASVGKLFQGTPYAALLQQARDGIVGRLGKRKGDFEHAARKFLFISQAGEVAFPERTGLLDDLIESVLRQRLIRLDYLGFEGDRRHLTLEPWSIAIYDHQLYVLAREDGSKTHRLHPYRLSRIRSHRVLAKTFVYPRRTSYDPDELFRDSFGIFLTGAGEVEEVLLRFDERWRTFANTHRWHSTHQVLTATGPVDVRMRVRVCNEFKAFILSVGADVEVVAPASLRASIAEMASALNQVYATSDLAPPAAPALAKRKKAAPKSVPRRVRATRAARARRARR